MYNHTIFLEIIMDSFNITGYKMSKDDEKIKTQLYFTNKMGKNTLNIKKSPSEMDSYICSV